MSNGYSSDDEQVITVVILEARAAMFYECVLEQSGSFTINWECIEKWDPAAYMTDQNGQRLFEEVERRLRTFWTKRGRIPIDVAISLPGTLEGLKVIKSSSRLKITSKMDLHDFLEQKVKIPCFLFHDVECLATGEVTYSPDDDGAGYDQSQTFVYIFADEGVGAKILINGHTYLGSGTAGLLGRLIVQPEGAYYEALRSSGVLEVFASRPWVSERLVYAYLSQKDKHGSRSGELADTRFRKSLRVAAEAPDGDRTRLSYEQIALGVKGLDPVAGMVLEVAAKHLGFAINAVITILSPHRIVLSGGMFTELPGFADQVIGCARQLSWANAWNNTQITISQQGRNAQVYGAVELWRKHAKNSSPAA